MGSKVRRLHSRAKALVAKFEQGGGTDCINEAITLDREALELCPSGHPKRAVSLNWLALHLGDRYNQLGAMTDLDEAIVLDREALKLRPPGHPNRPMFLNNLAADLTSRYKQLGTTNDFNEAIVLSQEAMELCPPGHPDRPSFLNSLADDLFTRYKRFGAIQDLYEAIVLDREALVLRLPGDSDRSLSLNNLAVRLYNRYIQLGAMEDLNEAIALDRTALELRTPGHPERSMSLNNLAVSLVTRYAQLGEMEDLNETVVLSREALELRPPGHPGRSVSLNNLANYLCNRYEQLGKMEDLGEAIVLSREALELRPPGHPLRSSSLSNLADNLSIRYKQLGATEDLDEAIAHDREALRLFPPGHARRPYSLHCLASKLHMRFTQLIKVEDKEELFSLYAGLAHVPQMASLDHLSATRAWICAAEDFQHPTTLLAYETYLRLLSHHLATLPSLPQHLPVLKNLASSLAVDAFSACLRKRAPASAVELLEQGRGVFWNQLNRLRFPLDNVTASGLAGETLANKFAELTSLIRNALDSPGTDQHDRVCHLNLELQRIVTDIRDLPGLSRFLLPPLFADLQRAASAGPVIIVNASQYSCDALVVSIDQDPAHIPLTITNTRVRDLSSEFHALTVHAKRVNVAGELALILRELWDQVVFPIVEFLQTTHPSQSRIWWCPTGEFSLLPLHAAGPYREGQQNLAEIYISSYTSTLTALIHARRPSPSNSATKEKRFVAIGQAQAIGVSELLSIGTELANIGQRVDGLAMFTRIEGPESCISRVTEELRKNEWVHLACRGLPNRKQPFESAFALHDGHFTIKHIIRCESENPQFAYLSASHTTVGDEESPDEVIHLASAMQFAGFRSLIGTMWGVEDGQTGKITSVFYDNMKDEAGRLDHTHAAVALHKTMKKSVDVPFDQRILYIHLGA